MTKESFLEYCDRNANNRTIIYELVWDIFKKYIEDDQTIFPDDESFKEAMSWLHRKYANGIFYYGCEKCGVVVGTRCIDGGEHSWYSC